ncbi:MAG: hypothetical protein HKN03_03825 [Acidimicrobiales bacterium]|nr:hypothetical protein [Acidimicrobiales bacterium]
MSKPHAVASSFLLLGLLAGCTTGEESQSPTFQVTAPELGTTTTPGAPVRLAWLGNPDLTGPERDMCAFIDDIDKSVSEVDEINAAAILQMEARAADRTLAEPLRARLKRDTAVANARRLASVFTSFGEGVELIDRIDPNERVSAEELESIKQEIERVVVIGETIAAAAETAAPLTATAQADYETKTGEEWVDLLTERELDDILEELRDETTGTGLEPEARELMAEIDDWSWRQCSEGFSD